MLLAAATAVVRDSGERKDKPATFESFHCLLKLLLSTSKATFFSAAGDFGARGRGEVEEDGKR